MLREPTIISNIEIGGVVQCNTRKITEGRIGSRTVCKTADSGLTSQSRHRTIGGNLPDRSAVVHHVEVPRLVRNHGAGVIKRREGSGSVIGSSDTDLSCKDAHQSRRGDLTDGVVGGVGNVKIRASVHRDAQGKSEQGVGSDSVVRSRGFGLSCDGGDGITGRHSTLCCGLTKSEARKY